jgi:hypothetical protein
MSLKIGKSKSKTQTQSQEHQQTQSQGTSQQQSQDWGLSRSRSGTFSNNQSNTLRTAVAPEWASSLTQGVAGRVASLNALDPNSFVAPAHALQNLAAARAGDLGSGSFNYDQAADMIRGAGQGSWLDARLNAPISQVEALPAIGYGGGAGLTRVEETAGVGGMAGIEAARVADILGVEAGPTLRGESLLDNLSAYMSPYTRDVVDSTLTDFDVDASRTRAQQDLDLAGSGAFGGSGAALTKSMTEGELARARANASALLRDQAFTRGAALSGEDAARRQQAQTMSAQLAMQRSSQNAQMAQDRAIQNAQFAQGASTQNAQMAQERAVLNAQLNQARAIENAQLAQGRALHNSGQAQDVTSQNAQLAQQRAIENARLSQQDWDLRTKAQLAGQDQRLRAGESLADLASTYDANARANIAAQAEMGGVLRGVDQEQRQAPIVTQQQIVAMLSGLPIGLFTGEQTSSSQTSQQVSDAMNAEAKGSSSSGSTSSSSVTDGTSSGTSKTKSSNFDLSITGEDIAKAYARLATGGAAPQ